MQFLNEKGEIINHLELERTEQLQAEKYILPDDVVLELGARYGTVSCVINKKLNNPMNQVSVEPDERVWDSLEKNIKDNGCNINLIKGVISNKKLVLANVDYCEGYGAETIESDDTTIINYTLDEVQTMYNLKFNVLVADCEGYLGKFLEDNPILYEQLDTILFETDNAKVCDYGKIIINLIINNFKNIESGNHEVWSKKGVFNDLYFKKQIESNIKTGNIIRSIRLNKYNK